MIFLFGTLLDHSLRAVVLGREVPVTPATASGWRVSAVEGGSYPVMRLDPEATAQGALLCDMTERERARMVAYEACFDYALTPLTVEMDGQLCEAETFLGQDQVEARDTPWDREAWENQDRETSIEAAAEMMRAVERGVPLAELKWRAGVIWARAASKYGTRRPDRPVTLGQPGLVGTVAVETRELPHERFFRLEELTLRHPKHQGGQTDLLHRTVFHVPDAITVVPYDPVRDHVLMVEQFRFGAFAHRDTNPWLIEPIAGMIDFGEDEATCACREAQEEAGLTLTPQNLHHISRFYPSPGGVVQTMTAFVACVDLPEDVVGVHGAQGEGEDIKSHLIARPVLMEMIETGEICDAATIISAQWIAMNKGKLALSASA